MLGLSSYEVIRKGVVRISHRCGILDLASLEAMHNQSCHEETLRGGTR